MTHAELVLAKLEAYLEKHIKLNSRPSEIYEQKISRGGKRAALHQVRAFLRDQNYIHRDFDCDREATLLVSALLSADIEVSGIEVSAMNSHYIYLPNGDFLRVGNHAMKKRNQSGRSGKCIAKLGPTSPITTEVAVKMVLKRLKELQCEAGSVPNPL